VSRTLRRGAVAAVIVAIAPVLAACSAGSSAATLEVKPNSAATSLNNGALKLNGVEIVADANGNAPANVVGNIANNEQQQEALVSVTVGGTAATLSGPGTIDSKSSLQLAGPNGGPGTIQATVPTLSQPAGANVPVTFVFANAGSVTVLAQIQAGAGQYAPYAPATPTPSPTETPSSLPPSPNGSGSPTAGASPASAHKPGGSKKASPSGSPTR
jgi:hypothetical protein